MASSAALNIDILANADKAVAEFDKLKGKAETSFSSLGTMATVASGAVLAGLGAATKAAADHQVAVSKLETAYRDAAGGTFGMSEALKDVEASSRRSGQSTEDSISAYTKLITATHNTADATRELSIARDLAAYKGISVADAAQMVIKVQMGQTKSLKALGIATKDAAGDNLTAADAMKKLEDAVKGQSDAFGETAEGKMARYRESLDQTKVAVGEALLPALTSVLDTLQPLFEWLSNNQAVLQALAPVIAFVAGGIMAVSIATKVWAMAQMILNSAMLANPIGIVILAIGALIAIIYLAVTHWDMISAAISTAFNWLKDLGSWILANWQLIIGAMLGPIGLLLLNLDKVRSAVEAVINALRTVAQAASNAIGWLARLPSNAGDLLGRFNPFMIEGGPAPTPILIQISALPGSDLPEVVYDAMREYQRRHARSELRPIFSGR